MDELLGKNMHQLIHHTRADGTLFPVEECRIFEVCKSGNGVHVEDEVLRRANGTSFPAEYWSYPQLRGRAVVGAVVAFIDITGRKLAELALANVSRRLIEVEGNHAEYFALEKELKDISVVGVTVYTPLSPARLRQRMCLSACAFVEVPSAQNGLGNSSLPKASLLVGGPEAQEEPPVLWQPVGVQAEPTEYPAR